MIFIIMDFGDFAKIMLRFMTSLCDCIPSGMHLSVENDIAPVFCIPSGTHLSVDNDIAPRPLHPVRDAS
jgi:hypothetical protein